jgi:hypothetical protein
MPSRRRTLKLHNTAIVDGGESARGEMMLPLVATHVDSYPQGNKIQPQNTLALIVYQSSGIVVCH